MVFSGHAHLPFGRLLRSGLSPICRFDNLHSCILYDFHKIFIKSKRFCDPARKTIVLHAKPSSESCSKCNCAVWPEPSPFTSHNMINN